MVVIERIMIIETMLTFIHSQKEQRHCFMKVPCLEIDGLVLTQSVAIMEYLADRWMKYSPSGVYKHDDVGEGQTAKTK